MSREGGDFNILLNKDVTTSDDQGHYSAPKAKEFYFEIKGDEFNDIGLSDSESAGMSSVGAYIGIGGIAEITQPLYL